MDTPYKYSVKRDIWEKISSLETEFRNPEAALSFKDDLVAHAAVLKRRITEDSYLTLGDIRFIWKCIRVVLYKHTRRRNLRRRFSRTKQRTATSVCEHHTMKSERIFELDTPSRVRTSPLESDPFERNRGGETSNTTAAKEVHSAYRKPRDLRVEHVSKRDLHCTKDRDVPVEKKIEGSLLFRKSNFQEKSFLIRLQRQQERFRVMVPLTNCRKKNFLRKVRSERLIFQNCTEARRHIRSCPSCSSISNNLALPHRLIQILLRIGCVEQNPGPSFCETLRQISFNRSSIDSTQALGRGGFLSRSIPMEHLSQLDQFPFTVFDVPADGHCQYHALSKCLRYYEMKVANNGIPDVARLRNVVTRHLCSAEFALRRPIFVDSAQLLDVHPFVTDEFLQRYDMRNSHFNSQGPVPNNFYGDDVSLQCIAEALNIEIEVVSLSNGGSLTDKVSVRGQRFPRQIPVPFDFSPCVRLHLLHDSDHNHYYYLLPKREEEEDGDSFNSNEGDFDFDEPFPEPSKCDTFENIHDERVTCASSPADGSDPTQADNFLMPYEVRTGDCNPIVGSCSPVLLRNRFDVLRDFHDDDMNQSQSVFISDFSHLRKKRKSLHVFKSELEECKKQRTSSIGRDGSVCIDAPKIASEGKANRDCESRNIRSINVDRFVSVSPEGSNNERNLISIPQLPRPKFVRRIFDKVNRLKLSQEFIYNVLLKRNQIKRLPLDQKLNRVRYIRLLKNQNIARSDLLSYQDYLKQEASTIGRNCFVKICPVEKLNSSFPRKKNHSKRKVDEQKKRTNRLVERYRCSVNLMRLNKKDVELIALDCSKRKKLCENVVQKRLLLMEKLSMMKKTNTTVGSSNESFVDAFHLDELDKIIEGMNFSLHDQALVCMERKEVLKLKEEQARKRRILYKRLNNNKLNIQTLIRYYKKKSDYLYGIETTEENAPSIQTTEEKSPLKCLDKTSLLMEKLSITKRDVNLIFTSPASVKLLSDTDQKHRLALMKKFRNRKMNLKKAREYLRRSLPTGSQYVTPDKALSKDEMDVLRKKSNHLSVRERSSLKKRAKRKLDFYGISLGDQYGWPQARRLFRPVNLNYQTYSESEEPCRICRSGTCMENNFPDLAAVSLDTIETCMKRYFHDVGDAGSSESVCSVCDTLVPKKNMNLLKYEDAKELLFPIVVKDRQNYNPSAPFDLELFHLSKFGIDGLTDDTNSTTTTEGKLLFNMCDKCSSCIRSVTGPKMPPFAIANGNDFGERPEVFKNLNLPEQALLGKIRNVMFAVTLRDGAGRKSFNALKGNVIAFPQHSYEVHNELPLKLNELPDIFQVVFLGTSLSGLKDSMFKKILSVNKKKIEDAIDHLIDSGMQVLKSKDNLSALPDDDIPQILLDNVNMLDPKDLEVTKNQDESEHSSYIPNDSINGKIDASDNSNLRVVQLECSGLIDNKGVTITSQDLKLAALRNLEKKVVQDLQRCGKTKEYIDEQTANFRKARTDHHHSAENAEHEKSLLVLRGSEPVSEFKNPDLWYDSQWCVLFPNRKGAPDDKRNRITPYSLHEWAKFAMNHRDDRFRTHPMFLLWLTNLLQRKAVVTRAQFKLNGAGYQEESELLNKINTDMIIEAATKKTTEHIEDKNVKALTKKLEVFTSSIAGTRFARRGMERDIRSLLLYLGFPRLFVTINPHDLNSSLVLYYANKSERIDIPSSQLPGWFERMEIAINNPVACAKFFDRVITAFLQHLIIGLGPNGGGVFGEVDAYYGTVEAQGRGTLHFHSMIWLKNFPGNEELELRLKCPCFRKKLTEYLDSIICASLPDLPEHLKTTKPKGDYLSTDPSFSVSSEEFKHHVYTIQKSAMIHSHAATCFKGIDPTKCRFDFDVPKPLFEETTVTEKGDIKLKRNDGLLNQGNEYILFATKSNMDAQFMLNSDDAKGAALYITKYITKDDSRSKNIAALLGLARNTIARRKKFEEDEKNKTENSAIAGASDSQTGKASEVDDTDVKFTADDTRRVFINVFGQSNNFSEMSAPQAASYILGTKDRYTSHSFTSLFIGDFLCAINNLDFDQEHQNENPPDEMYDNKQQDFSINVDTKRKKYSISNQYLDYVHRSPRLWNLSLYEFVAKYHKIKAGKKKWVWKNELIDLGSSPSSPSVPGSSSNPPEDNYYPFTVHHPGHDEYVMLENQTPLVPTIMKMPPRRNTNARSYAKMCLLLFKPFHSIEELCDVTKTSWIDIWDEYESSDALRGFNRDVYLNLREYHGARDIQDEKLAQRQQNELSKRIEEELEEDDGLEIPSEETDVDDSDVVMPLCAEDEDAIVQGIDSRMSQVEKPENEKKAVELVRSLCSKLSTATPVNYRLRDVMKYHNKPYIKSHGQYWRKEIKRQEALLRPGEQDEHINENKNLSQDPLEKLKNDNLHCGRDLNNQPGLIVAPLREPHYRDCLNQTIAEYGLNTKQSYVLKTIGEHFIACETHDSDWSFLPENQLFLLVLGEGGTGKTTLIKAINRLFVLFQKKDWLTTTASTGKAACLISGTTIHSECCYRIAAPSRGPTKTDMQTTLKRKWENKKYLIIDEISMISSQFFGFIDESLKTGKSINTKPFGGVNVILFGDFYQLPPVMGEPLYKEPVLTTAKDARQKDSQAKAVVGHNLFSFFDKAIILDEQLRQGDDGKFAKIVQHVRYGEGDEMDFDDIQDRLLPDYADKDISTGAPNLNFFDPTRQMSKIITSTNVTRRKMNAMFVETFARIHNQPVFKIYCTDNFFRGNTKTVPSQHLIGRVRDLPDEKTSSISGVLTVTYGMPIIILKNTSVALGVTNGSHGTLDRIIFNKDDKTKYDHSKFRIYHVNQLPEFLLIKFPSNTLKFKETEHLGEDLFPLNPSSGNFQLKYTKAKDSYSVKVSRRGFAVTPGFCITVHKSQGETLESGIVDLVPASQKFDAAMAYVALSRYRSLQTMHLLRKFDRGVISKDPRPGLADFYTKAKRMEANLIQKITSNRLYRDQELMV